MLEICCRQIILLCWTFRQVSRSRQASKVHNWSRIVLHSWNMLQSRNLVEIRPFWSFREVSRNRQVSIGLKSFLMLETCCKQESLVIIDHLEKFQKTSMSQLAYKSFFMLEICCKLEILFKLGYFNFLFQFM